MGSHQRQGKYINYPGSTTKNPDFNSRKPTDEEPEYIPIPLYVEKQFNKIQGGSYNAHSSIEKLAERFVTEMKGRYDLLFASQVVSKLKNAGLLRADVAEFSDKLLSSEG